MIFSYVIAAGLGLSIALIAYNMLCEVFSPTEADREAGITAAMVRRTWHYWAGVSWDLLFIGALAWCLLDVMNGITAR